MPLWAGCRASLARAQEAAATGEVLAVMADEIVRTALTNLTVSVLVLSCQQDTNDTLVGLNFQATAAEELRKFRSTRFSLTQRQLDNVWLWKDVNIGPHGRYLFNLPVPSVPAHWTVSAFGVSPTVGYGVLPEAVEVSVSVQSTLF